MGLLETINKTEKESEDKDSPKYIERQRKVKEEVGKLKYYEQIGVVG